MEKVEIKIYNGESWEETESTELEFEDWNEVSIFSKRLSKIVKTEVRVNNVGSVQGHYFVDGRSV